MRYASADFTCGGTGGVNFGDPIMGLIVGPDYGACRGGHPVMPTADINRGATFTTYFHDATFTKWAFPRIP